MRQRRLRVVALGLSVAVVAGACTDGNSADDPTPSPDVSLDAALERDTPIGPFTVSGQASTDNGPLAGVILTLGDQSFITQADGAFYFEDAQPGTITVTRPGYLEGQVDYVSGDARLHIELERRPVARALRVFSEVARSDSRFQDLLDLAEGTTVNTLVFDTKDETAQVLYATEVPEALELGFINERYDPEERIAQAKEAGLYTVTRIVTFEDANWAGARADHRLAGNWVDPVNTDVWEYPLGLAVEACELGFEEIQFDYVRFPTGATARAARAQRPLTEQQRIDAIGGFLAEAQSRLHPLGCAVSADIFGIVMSEPNDQGIGQRVEDVTQHLDAVSPMLYPSHYGPGWLGFDDPNEHPGPVIAQALDAGTPRVAAGVEMRPWIQAFWYNADQVRAQIEEAEARGAGWILWNYGGEFQKEWLPTD